jgi:hypothetical protein
VLALRNRDQVNRRILTARDVKRVGRAHLIGTIPTVVIETRAGIVAEADQEIGRLGQITVRKTRIRLLVVSRKRCLLEVWTTN